MPSKRSSAIIGIWVIMAILIIGDFILFQGLLLDSLFSGLGGLLNVMIIALIPVIFASMLLDRRAQPSISDNSTRSPPPGARSASGEPVTRTRPQPRIKRDKRAAQLETIVVEPGAASNSPVQSNSSISATPNAPEGSSSSARFLRSRRTRSTEDEEMDKQVQEQLDALELEMAKLEEQLEMNGITNSSSTQNSASAPATNHLISNTEASNTTSKNSSLSSEDASSELQAIDELLNRLEQRKRSGGVDEETYRRLREKYLKRRSELA
jgi:hypothetical protein